MANQMVLSADELANLLANFQVQDAEAEYGKVKLTLNGFYLCQCASNWCIEPMQGFTIKQFIGRGS